MFVESPNKPKSRIDTGISGVLIPNVDLLILTPATAYTIGSISAGVAGQILNIKTTNSNVTLPASLSHTGMEIPLIAGDSLSFLFDGTDWKQVSGNVGMGSSMIALLDGITVTDWISQSVITYDDVVMPSGVRLGANTVNLLINALRNTSNYELFIRPKGSTIESGYIKSSATAWNIEGHLNTPLGAGNIIQAHWSASLTLTINTCRAVSYTI